MSKTSAKKTTTETEKSESEKLQVPTGDCNVCDKLAKNLCSACKFVFYCGRDCQKKDWNSHKEDCKTFAKLPYRVNIFPFYSFSKNGYIFNLAYIFYCSILSDI